MISYLVLDLETSGEHSFGKFCNPLDPRNTVTSIALKTANKSVVTRYSETGLPRNMPIKFKDYGLLVGQNIKFDLLYLWENQHLQEWIASGGRVWDTMLAEYILEGQQLGHKSLDDLSKKYGGTLKDDTVGKMFKAGLKANEIDKDVLLEYNKADVENTEIVFLAQLRRAKIEGKVNIIQTYMRHLFAVTEMEYNGLHIDQNIARTRQKELEAECAIWHTKFYDDLKKIRDVSIDIDSPTQISALLFGGERTIVVREETGEIYKTGGKKGERKSKLVKKKEQIVGLGYIPAEDWRGKKASVFSVNEEVLSSLIKKGEPQRGCKEVISSLLKYREYFKLLSTYYYKEQVKADGTIAKVSGILPKLMPLTSTLHSEFRMTLTETGRLSSTAPNVQNLPAIILDMFTSRYGDDGCIIEADFSQLVVVIQAYLAQSTKMISDIERNVDFHRLRLGYALGMSYKDVVNVEDYDYKRKTIAKPISFQKAYGAMPKTVSERAGIDLEIVEKVFAAEDKAYPEIAAFYSDIMESLKYNRVILDKPINIKNKASHSYFTRFGENDAYGKYVGILGKHYVFKERAVLTKRGDVFRWFNQPDIQNYPVQGTAADLVALQVSELFLELIKHRDKCLLINEIHDSVIIDCKKEHKDFIISLVSDILPNVSKTFKKYFDLQFNVPIKIDIKCGDSWLKCKEE